MQDYEISKKEGNIMRIDKVDAKEINQMRRDYYKNLTSPMDDMYEEGIIPSYDFFEIHDEKGSCGFFATDSDNVMLQFFIKDKGREDVSAIFDEVITQNSIKKALCGTNDPIFYHYVRVGL